ncbi:MAG: class I SAM-dependent methyltransferase [Okeania sp. SIO3B5]|uniref:class I SAM-dependent DNA methyltransferase n=1 Tax=Okeania sp. SIO3B5 TaxID=2607811 RepID=UPI0013FFDD5A|nr:class I SAM-dependent methyltransferase [Okeania sp. SIO3B5]NEO57447.1 class I SAM-dependent methyltransferase [Okeania sp. SIO3B5]
MEQSKSNQINWFSEYTNTAQKVEKTGQYQPLIEWYDQNYEIFEGGTYAAKKCCQFLHQHIGHSSNLAILDLGCGTGDQGRILSEMGVKGSFYGIDMSLGMLESAKSKGLYKELKQSILPEIPYPDNTFDIVISAGTLCTPGNAPPQSLLEMIRVTKSAGILCFSYRQHWFENEESGWKKIHEEMLETGLMKQLLFKVDNYSMERDISGLFFLCQKC